MLVLTTRPSADDIYSLAAGFYLGISNRLTISLSIFRGCDWTDTLIST